MYVERDVREKFDKITKSYNMIALVGARQAGKTITVSAMVQKLINSGRVSAEQVEGIETQDELFARLAEVGIL